ncbi:purine-cytosine permease family protein [Desulfotruncus alcoholivorax]|uniref:purine-cytosine permease family protein n=1 Tax=Desulfotruncus alcoholivorax TaxID=265477 RepID=UPI00041F3500|nr:cytosine permease [Desulfotruncus alcoholivorax]
MQETTYQEKVLEVEPYGIEPIPKEERHGRPSQMFTIWFAINLNVVTWFTGFLGVEFGLSIKYAILAIIIGNIAGAAFLALSSSIGAELGQPLIPASKRAFGKAGVIGLSFLNLVNNIGWLGVNLVLAVMALQKILPLGYHSSLLLITAVTLLVAVYGYNFIHAFAHWMSLVTGALFVIMSVITVQNLPDILSHSSSGTGGFNLGMFILAIAVTFSYQISYCPISTDYARYLPENTPKKKLWQFSFGGALSVCIWLEILGALTATLGMHTGPMDFFAGLMGVFTIPALITVIISILPVNAMAMYSGGLAALAMGLPLKRWTSALITAGLGALIVSFGSGKLADTYTNFLLLLSYWIAPWLGVVLSDFYYHKANPLRKNDPKGWIGIASFLCGVLISIPFMSSVLYTGPVAKNYLGGADISYFLSLFVSVVVYHAAVKITQPSVMAETHAGVRH